MVIYDFDIRYGVFAFQAEADTILLIDTNAVLSLSIAAKLLQTIGGRNTQIFQTGGVIEHDQFAKGNFLNALRELGRKALMIYFSVSLLANYTHKHPLCGHCAPPLPETDQSLCALWA